MATHKPTTHSSEIKAIETRWNGYRFRSRTEARWAIALTHMGVKELKLMFFFRSEKDKINSAFEAARSARFEFGESPEVP